MSAHNYRVTFDRIGRTHDVQPLEAHNVLDVGELAKRIFDYARPKLLSRDVEVAVDLEQMRGSIFCGFNNGGTFTIEELAAKP